MGVREEHRAGVGGRYGGHRCACGQAHYFGPDWQRSHDQHVAAMLADDLLLRARAEAEAALERQREAERPAVERAWRREWAEAAERIAARKAEAERNDAAIAQLRLGR